MVEPYPPNHGSILLNRWIVIQPQFNHGIFGRVIYVEVGFESQP